MPIIITPGLGGILQFQNLTALAPARIGENIPRFWELPNPAQVETLASAYYHLSRVTEPNADLLEKLGAMVQRFEGREESIAADNFILSRLVGEMARLKDSVPPTPASMDSVVVTEKPSSKPSPKRDRDNSMQLYTDGKGGYFPHSWARLSEDMRRELKGLAYAREGRMSELTNDEEKHAEFLMGALAGWIVSVKDALTETGAKGAGQSGLASAPSVRAPLALISEMTAFMAGEAKIESDLGVRFWQLYSADSVARMAVHRLINARATQFSVLEEGERASLEKALFDLDVAYLRILLKPLSSQTEEAAAEAGNRDESYGDTLAKTLGDALNGLPLSERTELSPANQVQLTSAVSVLRILGRELSSEPPSPAVRGFLRRLLPREMLQLAQVVALVPRS